MLKYLNIKNFALIQNCEIDFSDGLNIITGETGAGKSILISALSILLGGRASLEQIRTGMEEAVLNATIDISNKNEIFDYLKDIGVTVENNEVIIRRILTSSGKSKSFINGTQVTTKEMNMISGSLFDFHGQHEGISLLKKGTHLSYLDNLLHIEKELEQLKAIFNELRKTQDAIKFLEESKRDKERQLELLKFEVQEIESANIKDQEDEELKKEISVYENIEKLISLLEEINGDFFNENGINLKLKNIKNMLTQISEMDQSFNNIANEFSDIYYRLEDLSSETLRKKDHYQYEPGKLDNLIERSEIIEKLKKKYGGSLPKVKEYFIKAKRELELITNSNEENSRLKDLLKELKIRYLSLANLISKKRREGKLILENKVKDALKQLSMNDVDFNVNIEILEDESKDENYCIINNGKKIKYSQTGIDEVEFLISPNKGEPLKSLIKIASGGELSRIILALKSILFEKDEINTMIFDEIDAGIGGKVALAVATALKKLSKHKQIICITHLAQIASIGDRNFRIQKNVVEDRTISMIENLDEVKKINEVARMLSGNITEISLKHAKELINEMVK